MSKNVPIKDFCKIDWGNTNLTKKSYVLNGDFLAVSAKGMDGRINFFEHENDVIVLSAIGAQCGKMFFPKQKFTAIKNTITIKPDINKALPDYLFYLFNYIELPKRGSAQPFISKGDIEKFTISFLPKLNEQKRIVEKLDACMEQIDKAIKNVEQNIQNAEDLFQSVLKQIFETKNSGWKKEKLGEILDIKRGGSPRPIKKFITDDPSGLNWIKISDATSSNRYIYKTKQKISKNGLGSSRFVENGDLILSNSMSFGKPYIMKTSGCIHDGWLVLKKIDDYDIDIEFLYHLLSSPYFYNQANTLATGSTVRNLNINLVSSINVLIPEIKEQKRVCSKIDKIKSSTDKILLKYNDEILALNELKQSILEKAFNGEL